MTKSILHSCVSFAALGMATTLAAPAFAADVPATPAAATADSNGLDTIVVTASRGDKTQLKSSVAVTSVTTAEISNYAPRSEASLLRLIPGINVQDTAGPGGNSNIGVRGIPVVTGGSEFVALQEDGLPVTLFGDIQFGNNDYWLRYDNNVERVESQVGGRDSTFTSQAPGAVVNYISKTGDKDGGSIELQKAVNYNENRLDFEFGSHIDESLRFHIGGFIKDGNGPTHIGFNAEQGYQIKANITKEFADGKGFIRLNFKRLDDKEPTFTTQPSVASTSTSGGVTTINSFSPLPNFDARNQSNASVYNQSYQVLTNGGQLTTVNADGIHPKVTSFGGEFHYEVGSNITVDDNFRYTDGSGTFNTQFVNVASAASIIGSSVNGSTVGSIVYANGPNQGKVYTGTYVNNNPNINTNISDIGSLANDLKVTGKFDLGGGAKLNATGGWFHFRQTIAEDWHVNQQINELSGNNPAQLDLFSGANGTGTQLSAAGQTGFNNNWGTCCARNVYLNYTDDAPFIDVDGNFAGLDLDGSVRFDSVKASGWSEGGVTGPNVVVTDALGKATLPSLIAANSPSEVLNYTKNYTSWSFGALYSLNRTTSVYLRLSRGGRFNSDRRTLGGNFNADGSLNAQGQATAVNFVTQQELGLKSYGGAVGGRYNVAATLFRSQLTDNNYDFTRISLGQNPITSNVYHTYGVEFNGNWRMHGFNLGAKVTYTHSTIVASASDALSIGKTPHALPALQYLITPSYDAGIAEFGFVVDGQSSTYGDDDNTLKIKGQTYINAFLTVRPVKRLDLGLNASNLFNTLGYRGSGGISAVAGGSANTAIFSNSAVLGRTITASLKYRF